MMIVCFPINNLKMTCLYGHFLFRVRTLTTKFVKSIIETPYTCYDGWPADKCVEYTFLVYSGNYFVFMKP